MDIIKKLRFRQVHLDFHTSEKIENIGEDFSKESFQEALKIGHVDSITVFSKCHHGWAYHPSEANVMHPHLSFDLLKAQIDAAHEIGVKTPVYISAGIDEKLARKHPEWLLRNKDESTDWVKDFTQPGYHLMCFNNPYLDILLSQIEEIVKNYDADGIFLDIVKPKPCFCQNCVRTMVEEGKDPYDEQNMLALGEQIYEKYTKKVREVVDKYRPQLPIFHNGGHITKGRRDIIEMNSHLEVESLPTGGWGYDHFPLSARYVQSLGLEFLGMTGKFHTMWGEFGGYKHPNALKYETALSIANGAKCSIGDQLHPSGQMDHLTYKIIGQAYQELEEKEPWCIDVINKADVAVLSGESVNHEKLSSQNSDYLMDRGAVRILLQSHILFDVIDPFAEFENYKVIILPDTIRLESSLVKKLNDFVKGGGKLLVTGESGLDAKENRFVLDLGVSWQDRCQNRPNYFKPDFNLETFSDASFVFYEASERVKLTGGKALAWKQKSFFNREVFNFCSHQHAPNSMEYDGPGMVESELGIYIPWKIFTDYARLGSLPQRQVVTYALKRLLGDDITIKTNLPSQGIVTVMNQEELDRTIIHLLYGSPIYRGNSSVTSKPVEVIEDLIPIYDTRVHFKTDRIIKSIYKAPERCDVDFEHEDEFITFTINKFTCHQMIVIEYEA